MSKHGQLISIVIMMLLSVSIHGQYVSTETLAIPFFKNNAENNEYAWLSEALADMLTTDIAATKKIWVVNRLDLKKVLEEQKLSLSGMISDESMVNLGNLSGASLILTGSFTIYGDQIRIDAKVFNTETGTSQGAASTMGAIQDIFVLEKRLAVQALGALSIPISDDEKINLFQIASGNLKAIENNYRGVIALDQDDKDAAQSYFKEAVSVDPYYREAQANLDVVTKAIDGGSLFAAALGELGEKDRQLASLKIIMKKFKKTAIEMKVVGNPQIITNSTDPSKVDIKITLNTSLDQKSRSTLLSSLLNISAGTTKWSMVDMGDYSKRHKDVNLFDENAAWLENEYKALGNIKLIQLQSHSKTLYEIPIFVTVGIHYRGGRDAGLLRQNPYFFLTVNNYRGERGYQDVPGATKKQLPSDNIYTIKDVPIGDIKMMTKVTIKDVTDDKQSAY
jgi:TolB-like protein